ncbi:MAG: hypothetical protein WA790_00460 [Sulfitobacter sp.]
MNDAMAILAHALRMLVHEPGTTFRVITPALLLVLGSAIAAVVFASDAIVALQAASETMVLPPASSILLLFGLGLAGLFGYALMAILWHRHVLLNGDARDSDLRPNSGVILGYIWRAIILGFVQFLVAIPIGMAIAILGGIGAAFSGGVNVILFTIVGVAAGVVFIWVALRLSVVLPAASLGNIMRIGESWQVTAPAANALWGVAVLLAVINTILTFISTAIMPGDLGFSLVFQTVIYIIEGLVFVSVLTTLYGHLVEGRPLR